MLGHQRAADWHLVEDGVEARVDALEDVLDGIDESLGEFWVGFHAEDLVSVIWGYSYE